MEIDFIKLIEKANPDLLIFVIGTFIAFISWLVKSVIERPIASTRNTFESYFKIRIEVLIELKNRLSFIFYLKDGNNHNDVKSFKEGIQNILLRDGKTAYISQDILDLVLRLVIIEETNAKMLKEAIDKIDEELYTAISKVRDDLQFYQKFSHRNPFKRFIAMVLISVQYLFILIIFLVLFYYVTTTFISGTGIARIGLVTVSLIVLCVVNKLLKA